MSQLARNRVSFVKVWRLPVLRLAACVIVFACLLAACTDRREADGAVTVSIATWIQAVVAAACIVALLVWWSVPKVNWRARAFLMMGFLVGSGIVVPSIMLERVVISSSGLSVRTGMWFAPAVVEVKFADVVRMSVPSSQAASRVRTPISIVTTAGKARSISQSDLVTQCLDDIASAARLAGVRVTRVDSGN